MEYETLSHKKNSEILKKRLELEDKERKYYYEWKKVQQELESLKKTCKHEHATLKTGWQGGGIYYCNCTCPECGRSGDRYVPQYHMQKNNEWYKNTKYHITLEQAIEMGKRMGENPFESSYWWGEVENYTEPIKK